jgi:hypothetical protein
LDSSIVQGPFSVAPCQTLISRFATFASPYVVEVGAVREATAPREDARDGVGGRRLPRLVLPEVPRDRAWAAAPVLSARVRGYIG